MNMMNIEVILQVNSNLDKVRRIIWCLSHKLINKKNDLLIMEQQGGGKEATGSRLLHVTISA